MGSDISVRTSRKLSPPSKSLEYTHRVGSFFLVSSACTTDSVTSGFICIEIEDPSTSRGGRVCRAAARLETKSAGSECSWKWKFKASMASTSLQILQIMESASPFILLDENTSSALSFKW